MRQIIRMKTAKKKVSESKFNLRLFLSPSSCYRDIDLDVYLGGSGVPYML